MGSHSVREEFPSLFGRDIVFDKYSANEVTAEFAVWWLGYYGGPEDYLGTYGEQHEYFVRCAFALKGWLASKIV